MSSVLIVDDLLSIHEMLDAVIQPTGFSTAFATDGEKALARYKSERFDLILADIDMKPMDGITLLKQVKLYDPSVVVIIMTAYASTDSAVQALKFGAFDYLQKPFRVDELIATLKRGIEFKNFQTARDVGGVVAAPRFEEAEARLLGNSARNKKLLQQVRKLLGVRTPVLLQGETGTGKTTVAEVLHEGGAAAEAPLIRIDCSLCTEGNFREGLLGANGAGGTWVGQAKGGTLLLQNLHCLSLPMQKELVSVLRNTAHGFRLICTTCEDLEKLTDDGQFDDELFYRVAALPVSLSPLRDRAEDVPLLVQHYCKKATHAHFDPGAIEFAPDALAVLAAYGWPGNLSELGQVVTQIASSTNKRIITSEQLPLRLKSPRSWPSLGDYLAGQRRHYVDLVLHACKGDRLAAARILEVDVTELG